jgi:hypothetical protein
LFSALVEGQGDMKRAVVLQPAAFSYAESLLKFAFLLNKEVWSSHFKTKSSEICQIVLHSNYRTLISAVHVVNRVNKKFTEMPVLG